jgi:hypothetical protein
VKDIEIFGFQNLITRESVVGFHETQTPEDISSTVDRLGPWVMDIPMG